MPSEKHLETRQHKYRRIDIERVLDIIGEPETLTLAKVQDKLDRHLRRFIAHSPFLCMATGGVDGDFDCSPRGDYPGFARVLDERTLAIPDRVGNRLVDSLRNIAVNPGIGLNFLVPGHRETLRVNGYAYVTDEPDVLARLQVEGKLPSLAIIVEVKEAYIHCGRAIIRSRLWDPKSQLLATEVPSMGEIVEEQLHMDGVTADVIDGFAEDGYKTLY
ncbi:MSMEG_1061 family FMN-dependent PPOX-type flavoprotein [Pimelobacter simplex]|jgi:uncharacterized protein|uniref:MSMEG_1061 family FMN-dependent PPOX-type flavoprotein n=1 Tax=Nocardioides simplex TaxID=2045 RepID=UPI0019315B16|nr:pyridoxamine 5'-phosphate oxidase family protein [Pimelobacter simplex]